MDLVILMGALCVKVLKYAVLLLVASCATMQPTYETSLDSAVQLEDGFGPFCSGILVSPTQVATAAHCIMPGGMFVRFADGHTKKVLAVRGQGVPVSDTDWAILKIEQKRRHPIAPVSCERPPLGSYIYHVGRSPGHLSVSDGIISAYDTKNNEWLDWAAGLVIADLTGGPGASGGGIFNQRGELIGLMVGGILSTGWSLYIPTDQTGLCPTTD